MLAFATSPYIVTTWIGGPVSDSIIRGPGFRWGFGIFAIITPFVVGPLCLLFLWNNSKAKKLGLVEVNQVEKRSWLDTVKHYIIEVDLIGIILLAGGMALFLLPFGIYSYQNQQWQSPMIICMIIFGAALIVAFLLYEKYAAPVNLIPVRLLADRTVFFGGMMLFFVFFCAAIWGSYFSSMLLVVWNQGVTKTTYITNIYRVGSCFSALLIGVFVRWTGRFKWVAVYYGIPLMMLGVGLLLYFRYADQSIGYVVMTQIFIAFAGGPIVIAGEMAMMSPVDHQHIAIIMAILDLFGSVGTAVGSTVAAAIWTGVFPVALKRYLPSTANFEFIYGSIYSQLGYPVGTPTRTAISLAYADAQQYMLIASISVLALGLGCAWLWRDIKLKDVRQVQGNVV
jgi:MFS family permease